MLPCHRSGVCPVVYVVCLLCVFLCQPVSCRFVLFPSLCVNAETLTLLGGRLFLVPPPPPRVQEPAMFDRGTKGRFLRTLFPLNSTAEPGVGSCARPWATPYRGKKIFRRIAPGHVCPLLSHS